MIKKTIPYEDLNGNQLVDDFYFNISKSELIDMQIEDESFQSKIQRIVDTKDNRKLQKLISDLIDKSYGVRSSDGIEFLKDADSLHHFKATNAYDVLRIELATDADKLTEFVKGIMPKDLMEKAEEESKAQIEELQNHQKNIPAPPVK